MPRARRTPAAQAGPFLPPSEELVRGIAELRQPPGPDEFDVVVSVGV